MRKIGIIITIILIFLIIYFLQSNFFSWFLIYGVKPNLFIVFVLIIGLFMGRKYGLCFGIGIGLLIDFLIGRNIGVSSVMLGIVGLIGGYIDKNFSKDSRIMFIAIVAITTIVFELGQYLVQSYILSYNLTDMNVFIKILSIEIIYNILLTIILYPLIKKWGYYIEGNFKESNILTKYY